MAELHSIDIQNIKRTDYRSLMQRRINNILFICNNYDAFMMREDGEIEDKIQKEYENLNLTTPPSFTWIASSSLAAQKIDEKEFDLIISIFNFKDLEFFETMKEIKAKTNIPVVLLINYSKKVTQVLKEVDDSAIDHIFSWNRNANLITAIIKLIEDKMNADNDILQGKVRAILLVEDSIRFYSSYLPEMYKLIFKQSAEFINEATNVTEFRLRRRARPKILLAKNLEEALELFYKYKNYYMGVISDIAFVAKKGDKPETEISDAGIMFAKTIQQEMPDIPIILQSSQKSMETVANEMGVSFIEKGSKTLHIKLSKYMSEKFSFGDYVITNEDGKRIIARVSTLDQLQETLRIIPDNIFGIIVSERRLSRWLYSRGLFRLASIMRKIRRQEGSTIQEIRDFTLKRIEEYRMSAGQGVIAKFANDSYSKYVWFSKIGKDSIGGKARGLAFVNNIISKHQLIDKYKDITISIPRTITIASDYFDNFIMDNGLQYVIDADISNLEILSEFVSSRLPEKLLNKLKIYLETVNYPLAVRSSSILEDSHYQPFAGIYSTYMIPYTDNTDQMLRLLSKAIKSVYASVYFNSSRSYIQSTSNMISEEKMAVVIQRVCGTEDKGYYFPTMSGVARSINYYPIGHEKAEDGIVNMAFGLGKLVVDGEKSMRFSPKHPKATLQLSTPRITLKDTQTAMYALNLKPEEFKTSLDDGINIQKFTIPECEEFRNLKYVASTWDMNDSKLVPHINAKGRRLITFSRILQYNTLPIPQLLSDLMNICRKELGSEIEIEFAVDMDVPNSEKALFSVLQVRQISEYDEVQSIDINTEAIDTALVYSQNSLGFGLINDVTDIIYIRDENFDKSKTTEIANEIGKINKEMLANKRNYILLGPGRWGSSDPWLGIPISWDQISEAKVIIECGLPDFNIDPSQGTHFFQNITSLGIGYLTINPFANDGIFRKEQLNNLECDYQSHFIQRFRFPTPPAIYIDGKNGKGIINL